VLPLTVDVVPKDREEKEEELLEAVLRAGLLDPPPPLRLDQIEDMCVVLSMDRVLLQLVAVRMQWWRRAESGYVACCSDPGRV
jgi:hypothetical protein